MIEALLFDKDATLLDFEKTWGDWSVTFLTEIADGNVDLLRKMAGAIQFDLETRSFDPRSPVIAGTPEEGVDLILPFLPHWDRQALLAHSNETSASVQVHEIVPLAALLDELGTLAKLGIATNDIASSARRHMESVGVADRFAAIIGSDSGFGGKPGPGMCLAFADQTGIEPAKIAMVGDSLHDLHAGRAAGMVCVGVTSGFATEAELSPHADVVFADVSHLPNWMASR
ncbi:HAD family hydrolase [Litoreibacter sp.]|nr:HAD family hydrolase [Litoreibacter sp.]